MNQFCYKLGYSELEAHYKMAWKSIVLGLGCDAPANLPKSYLKAILETQVLDYLNQDVSALVMEKNSALNSVLYSLLKNYRYDPITKTEVEVTNFNSKLGADLSDPLTATIVKGIETEFIEPANIIIHNTLAKLLESVDQEYALWNVKLHDHTLEINYEGDFRISEWHRLTGVAVVGAKVKTNVLEISEVFDAVRMILPEHQYKLHEEIVKAVTDYVLSGENGIKLNYAIKLLKTNALNTLNRLKYSIHANTIHAADISAMRFDSANDDLMIEQTAEKIIDQLAHDLYAAGIQEIVTDMERAKTIMFELNLQTLIVKLIGEKEEVSYHELTRQSLIEAIERGDYVPQSQLDYFGINP